LWKQVLHGNTIHGFFRKYTSVEKIGVSTNIYAKIYILAKKALISLKKCIHNYFVYLFYARIKSDSKDIYNVTKISI